MEVGPTASWKGPLGELCPSDEGPLSPLSLHPRKEPFKLRVGFPGGHCEGYCLPTAVDWRSPPLLAQAWLRRCSGGATHNTQTLDYSHQGHHAPRSDHVAQGLAAREPGDEQAWEGLFLPSVLSYVTLGQAVRLSPPSWLGSCSGVAMPPHRLTPTPSRKHKPPAAQIEPTRRAEDRVHPGGLRPGSQQP